MKDEKLNLDQANNIITEMLQNHALSNFEYMLLSSNLLIAQTMDLVLNQLDDIEKAISDGKE